MENIAAGRRVAFAKPRKRKRKEGRREGREGGREGGRRKDSNPREKFELGERGNRDAEEFPFERRSNFYHLFLFLFLFLFPFRR